MDFFKNLITVLKKNLNIITSIKDLLNLVNSHVIFVVISLLVLTLVFSSRSSVLAAKNPSPRDVCDVFSGPCFCDNDVERLTASCCVVIAGNNGKNIMVCEKCSINTDTGDYFNCQVFNKPTKGLANVPQGGGVLEQPPKQPKHGGTVLPKGGGVLEQPQTGESTAKKGSNNNNSPTPPACPDKGPIPPNCTLKPKF